MKIENTIKVMKEVHKDRILFVKVGTFYHCYGRDAIITSYLFQYCLKKVDGIYNCGFSATAINKVKHTLDDMKISYMELDRSDNYSVIDEQISKENAYESTCTIAKKYVNRKNRIDDIYNSLLENINDENIKEKIIKIEEILYEI